MKRILVRNQPIRIRRRLTWTGAVRSIEAPIGSSCCTSRRRWLSTDPSDRNAVDGSDGGASTAATAETPTTLTTGVGGGGGGGGPTATTTSPDAVDEPSVLLKAPFRKVSTPGLFPWRHEAGPPPRLVPGTPDYETKGLLLGGNVVSSSPNMDALATEYIFLKVPWYNLLFFRRSWEEDLVESMQWAFFQAVPAVLSNTFAVPFRDLASTDYNVQFSHESRSPNDDDDDDDSKSKGDHDGNNNSSSSNDNSTVAISDYAVEKMVHPELLKLYRSAREFGNQSLRVRLELKPTTTDESAVLVNMFAFPFLSRSNNKLRKKKYNLLLDSIAESGGISTGRLSDDAVATVHEFMEEFRSTKVMESTVICQVLIPCDEIFCVKDAETGRLLQGHADEKPRRVVHLVRFEQTVTARWTARGGILPFRVETGEWQITDIDDLLEGNLML